MKPHRLSPFIFLLFLLALLAAPFLPCSHAADGDLITTFNPNPNGGVVGSAVQPDGKIVIGGTFTAVGGAARTRIARLNADGTADTGFNPSADVQVFSTSVQPDGRVLIGGIFNSINGVARRGLARLNANGSLDAGFNPNVDGLVYSSAPQSDGRIVIGGSFSSVGGVDRENFARVNADGTFDPSIVPFFTLGVYSTTIQVDGRMVVGGDFQFDRIARLNFDGTLDATFRPNANGRIQAVAAQADGRILIAGTFTSVAGNNASGTPRNRIARFNADGTLDATFNPDVNSEVKSMVLQADGRIIIGGDFTTVGGITRNRLARLNANGTLDAGFNPNPNLRVDVVTLLANGQILIAGNFTTVGGATRNRLALLANSPATQSLTVPSSSRVQWLRGGTTPETTQVTFELSTDAGANWTALGAGTHISGGWELTGLGLPASGSIRARARTAGGQFNGSSGLVEQTVAFSGLPSPDIAVYGFASLIADGDTTPNPTDGTDFGTGVAVDGGQVERIFSLDNFGNAPLDLTGNPRVMISGANAGDFSVTIQPQSPVAPGIGNGAFFWIKFDPSASGLRTANVSISNDDPDENPYNFAISGTGNNELDPTFDASFSGRIVRNTVVLPDGRIVVASLRTSGGTTSFGISRINADGTHDPGFRAVSGLNSVGPMLLQPDGKIVIGGSFFRLDATTRNSIARLNADGTLDLGFDPDAGNSVSSLSLQVDGRIIVGGIFGTIGGVTRNYIARLNADGTLDANFNPDANGSLATTAVQPDGKIIMGGLFTTVGGATRNRIARLNADGTLDTAFNPNANSGVSVAAIQADGKIVISGAFTSVGGSPRNGIARLNPDGTLDAGFNPDIDGGVWSVSVQVDGRMVIGGDFTTVDGVTRNRIARLNANGSLDAAFNPNANDRVITTALQADGRVIVGGDFTAVSTVPQGSIARLLNGPATQTLTVPSAARVQWLRGGTAPETTQVSFELSSNGGETWTPLGSGTRINGGWELTDLSLPASGTVRARARTDTDGNGSSGLVEQQTSFFNAPFAPVTIPGLQGISDSSVSWADYDSDGRLDLFLTGDTGLQKLAQLWRNTGAGFNLVPIAGLAGVSQGSVAWSDYDNDGRLDFLIMGNAGPANISQLWRNTGIGFAIVPIPGLPAVLYGAVAWADYDRDGRQDFLITGNTGSSSAGSTNIAQLWRNTGSGFVQVPVPGIPDGPLSSVAWGDYDNDERPDFLITGAVGTDSAASQLWRNTGSGFVQVPIPGLPGVYNGAVAWGDYDNDGRLDFLLTGFTGTTPVAQVWQNTGSGFANVTPIGFPQVYQGGAAWGDYDNDGRLDILVTGGGASADLSQVWRNTGATFAQVTNQTLPGTRFGSVAWADFDNDGRLDFFLTGLTTGLWKNSSPAINTAPSAPTALASQVHGASSVTLRWNPATDAQTPSAGLSYNLVLGTSANAVNVASPNASVPDGFRRVVRLGAINGAAGPLAYTFTNLPPAPQYFWSVQAIDSAYAGGPFASAQSFLFETTQITVLNTNDAGPGSLRQAIADVSADGTISFAPDLIGRTIGLTSGELVIDKHLTITGPGADKLRLSGNGVSRVIRVASNAVPHVVSITDLTIANGNGIGGGVGGFRVGGGIVNDNGSLTVDRCTLSDNTGSSGGGIHNWGQAGWASLTVRSSTFSGNEGDGGGIFNAGTFGTALLHVENCTFSGNSGTFNGGGAIWNEQGVLTLIGSTLTGNRATRTNGLAGGLGARGTEHLTNTIVMGNFNNTGAEDNISWGNIDDYRTCLIGPPNASSIPISSLLNTNLAFNGGATRTHALVRGSPAIDAGPGYLPNAWQITDASGGAGAIFFTNTLTVAQKIAATNDGWRFTVVSRLVDGSGGGTPAQFMSYGHGNRRFVVGWDLDVVGRLTARFYGAGGSFNGIATNLTGPSSGTSAYHQHELVYSPATRTATYLLDGVPVFTWPGLVPNADYNGQAFFGAAASGGRGRMNYHHVQFAITGQGTVSEYFAGYQGNPALASDPVSQGWTRVSTAVAGSGVTNAPVSPDAVALPNGLLDALGLLYDQRGPGFDRVGNGRIDIGAYEVQQPKVTQAGKVPQGFAVSFKGEPNETLNIEWNADAKNGGWQPLTTGTTDASRSVQVIDSTPSAPRRFYRSVRP